MKEEKGHAESLPANAMRGHAVDEGEQRGDEVTTPPLKRRRLLDRQDDSQGETQEQGQPAEPIETATHVAEKAAVTDSLQDQTSESEPCSICLDPLVSLPSYELPSCRHAFHVSCLLQAFRRSHSDQLRCPMCRGTGAEATTNLRPGFPSSDVVQEISEVEGSVRNTDPISLQLFSASPLAASEVAKRFRQRGKAAPEYRFAKLEISELRTVAASLHALGRRDGNATSDNPNTVVLGRKDLANKVPRSLIVQTLAPGSLGLAGVRRAIHVLRYMSRDAILIEIVEGSRLLRCFPLTLGFHIKRHAEQVWTWISEGQSAEIGPGDKVALISEHPRGSTTRAPPCSIQADDFGCLLGLRLEGV